LTSFKLSNAELFSIQTPSAPQQDLCKSGFEYHRYDSKYFQIPVPIYYLQGSADPQTPIKSARYHFKHQRKASKKIFQVIKGGGHRPTESRINICTDQVWQMIFNAADFSGVLDAQGNCL
jgi:pimeloyl-ACP methyl ester carboxylesterase